jgi:DNA-binding NtrC family response regulator
VDALSPKAQVTLLRFLQDQRYRPVGTPRELVTDVRLLAAANRPLEAAVEHGEFRADLMYRLKILHLCLPPLRERGDDVVLLAEHFAARFAAKYQAAPKGLHPLTRDWLRRYPWPGNVRELENWVHRQFLMSPGPDIVHGDDAAAEPVATAQAELLRFQQAKAEAVRLFERDYLSRALQQAEGNVTRAAHLAGKERRAFGKLLKKHGLARSTAH